jgi:alginate O-acetyltransferase complex protein AlgI
MLGGGRHALLDIVLPLGISFFTFTQIAFLVDVRSGIAREYSFVHYLLFVTYFPHLIAGPIIHHREVMPQFAAPETYRPRGDHFAIGLTLFTIGLAKKVLLADNLAEYADAVFDAARDGERPPLIAAWAGALSYTLQLYFDFSGYSDMAVGLSLLFGIRLPFNFDSPYKARNIAEFWRRWHMTLSRFLRDYLYIPLGGNRHGPARRYVNLFVTMVLGGLWHGASWTFVAWGALHGAYLVLHHGWRRWAGRAASGTGAAPAASLPALLLTFLCVVVGWVFFRAADFETARVMLLGMAGANGVSLPKTLEPYLGALRGSGWIVFEGGFGGVPALAERGLGSAAAFIAGCLAIVWALPNSQQLVGLAPGARPSWTWRPTRGIAVATGLLLGAALLHFARVSPFLYYQF